MIIPVRYRLGIVLLATAAWVWCDSYAGAQEPEATEPGESVAAAEVEETGQPTERKDRAWINGRFETGVDAAWDGSGNDIELYQLLRMDIAPPKTPKLKLRGSFWLTQDLDGDEHRYSTLYSIDDSYGGDVRVRTLDLYLQADDILGGAQLRLGRQRILDGPLYNRIDGLRLRWDKPRWDAYLYAGTRASLYDQDSFEDLVTGVGAGFRPTVNTRLGLDLYHAEDDRKGSEVVRRRLAQRLLGRAYPREVGTRVEDQTLGLSFYQRFGAYHWMNAELLLHDDGAHEFSMDFSGTIEHWKLTYLLNYRRQFDRVSDRADEVTGYYRILGGLEPYHHLHLGVQRPVTEKLSVGLEADIRDADRNTVYGSNTDYVRVALALFGNKIADSVDFNVSIDRWNVSGGEGSWIVTGEVSRTWEAVEWAVGLDYERYRYEYVEYNPWPNWVKRAFVLTVPGVYPGFSPLVLLNDTRDIVEREDIYSVYTRVQWKLDERQRITAKLVYEDDDGPFTPFWRIKAAYELDF